MSPARRDRDPAALLADPTRRRTGIGIPLPELALRFGNAAQAQAAIEKALARKPEDPTLLGILGDALAVSGLVEADLVFQSMPKPDGWSEDLAQMCRIRSESVSTMQQALERILGPSGPGADSARTSAGELYQARYALAQLYAYTANMDKAVQWWREAKKGADTEFTGARDIINETLGIALLHKAEMDNGVYRTPGDMCLFPPRAGHAFADTTAAEEAQRIFTSYLADTPGDLEVKWLLNLAAVTLGRYPDGVPAQHLIPPSAFASPAPIGRPPSRPR